MNEKPVIVIKFTRGDGREIVLAPLSLLREEPNLQPTVLDALAESGDEYDPENLGWGHSSRTDSFGRVGRSGSQASVGPPPGLEEPGPSSRQGPAPSSQRSNFIWPLGGADGDGRGRARSGRQRQRDRKRRREQLDSQSSSK